MIGFADVSAIDANIDNTPGIFDKYNAGVELGIKDESQKIQDTKNDPNNQKNNLKKPITEPGEIVSVVAGVIPGGGIRSEMAAPSPRGKSEKE